jgi:hypothetical protein
VRRAQGKPREEDAQIMFDILALAIDELRQIFLLNEDPQMRPGASHAVLPTHARRRAQSRSRVSGSIQGRRRAGR